MKRNSTVTLTASKFASLVGADRHEIAKKLSELNARPVEADGRGDYYHLRDLVNALNGGDERAERIRKNRAESERIELQNARTRGELVEIAAVKKLGERVMIAIRQKILGFPLTDDEKDGMLRELMAMKDIDWSREP
jgi:phage terminase Nu1 subunit (DNA packaging protein)